MKIIKEEATNNMLDFSLKTQKSKSMLPHKYMSDTDKFNMVKEIMYDVEKILHEKDNLFIEDEGFEVISDTQAYIYFTIEGDWKHEHAYLNRLVENYLTKRGFKITDEYENSIGTSESDWYTAQHYFYFNFR